MNTRITETNNKQKNTRVPIIDPLGPYKDVPVLLIKADSNIEIMFINYTYLYKNTQKYYPI